MYVIVTPEKIYPISSLQSGLVVARIPSLNRLRYLIQCGQVKLYEFNETNIIKAPSDNVFHGKSLVVTLDQDMSLKTFFEQVKTYFIIGEIDNMTVLKYTRGSIPRYAVLV